MSSVVRVARWLEMCMQEVRSFFFIYVVSLLL